MEKIKIYFQGDNKSDSSEEEIEKLQESVRSELKIGRNAPCPCGSGKKYKKCCLMV